MGKVCRKPWKEKVERWGVSTAHNVQIGSEMIPSEGRQSRLPACPLPHPGSGRSSREPCNPGARRRFNSSGFEASGLSSVQTIQIFWKRYH